MDSEKEMARQRGMQLRAQTTIDTLQQRQEWSSAAYRRHLYQGTGGDTNFYVVSKHQEPSKGNPNEKIDVTQIAIYREDPRNKREAAIGLVEVRSDGLPHFFMGQTQQSYGSLKILGTDLDANEQRITPYGFFQRIKRADLEFGALHTTFTNLEQGVTFLESSS